MSPAGLPSNDGSIERPLDLVKALGSSSPARPGDTIWLRGGTYRGAFVSWLRGAEGAPIVVRQYPGERATIDSAPRTDLALLVRGPWTTFWGFEITNSDPKRTTADTGSWPSDLRRGGGATALAPHVKFINLVVHDLTGGVGLDGWTGSEWSEAYGNIIYNNGWHAPDRAHGHGLYAQNRDGTRFIRDNIIFNQFSHGIHIYGSATAYLDNMWVEGNVLFNNGALALAGYERDLLIGGGRVAQNPVVRDNATYGGAQLTFGYAGCANGSLTGNYLVGAPALILVNCNPVVTGNTVYSAYGVENFPSRFPSNIWHSKRPTGVVTRVRPNLYEPGRANVVIYNWDRRSHVEVDLAPAGLSPNQSFEIRDAQDFYGTPVVTGIFVGAPVAIPMSGLRAAPPIGNVPVVPPHTSEEFGAFVVLPSSAATIAPSTPTLTANPTSLVAGAAATLSWSAPEAVSVTITPGAGSVAQSGSVSVTPAQSTTYTLTARYSDGTTATATANIAVTAPLASVPTVTITSPTAGAVAPSGSDVRIEAAVERPENVTKVAFYAGTTLVGEAENSPYLATWSNVASGSYQLVAKAFAGQDVVAVSSAVSLIVNAAPVVRLAAPTAGATLSAPAALTLEAIASDGDDGVAKVQFYQGSTLLGEDTSSPYTFVWNNIPAGTYVVTARAIDTRGAGGTSAGVSVAVVTEADQTLTLSSSAGSALTAPANLAIAATIADPTGAIARVEFYQGARQLLVSWSAPYTLTIRNLSAGSYVYTARAYYRDGRVVSSLPLTIVVNALPTVRLTSPSGTVIYTAGTDLPISAAAADAEGRLTMVEFFSNGTKIGEATAAPYAMVWTNIPGGSHVLTARATDVLGGTTSSTPVNIRVNVPPTVTMTVENAQVLAPGVVMMDASASDPDGSITRVDFYQGGTIIGRVSGAPYRFTWINVAPGTYSLTARAYDSNGAPAVSTPVVVTVSGR